MKFALLILSLILPLCSSQAQSSGARCVTNLTAPPANSYYWPPDAKVKVYFHRAMFTAPERETLLAAVNAWSEIAHTIGTGVEFTYAGEIDGIIDCTYCLRVTRRDVHRNDRKHYAFFYPLKLDADGLLLSARIDLDFGTKSAEALQAFMAHELGHGMGLWDCDTCKKKKTIMTGFPGVNRDNGLLRPSDCDVAVVKEIYEVRRRLKNSLAENVKGQP